MKEQASYPRRMGARLAEQFAAHLPKPLPPPVRHVQQGHRHEDVAPELADGHIDHAGPERQVQPAGQRARQRLIQAAKLRMLYAIASYKRSVARANPTDAAELFCPIYAIPADTCIKRARIPAMRRLRLSRFPRKSGFSLPPLGWTNMRQPASASRASRPPPT